MILVYPPDQGKSPVYFLLDWYISVDSVAIMVFPAPNKPGIHNMPLTEKQKRELRGRGHSLKPVVSIGNAGLKKAVLREIELSLDHHELMKLKIGGAGRAGRDLIIAQICDSTGAELVQAIGHIALVYRERSD